MNHFVKIPILLTFLLLLLPWNGNGARLGMTAYDESKSAEFRAVWIATINNIDWPSKPNLTVAEQKAEFLALLDKFQKFNLNVVILQVRAASDAFYPSKTEPWSLFLTGKQGRPPKPFYDPLAWAVEMCHQRGMELHAWFNPFRVRNLGFYQLDPNSFASKHPQYVREFDKKYFLDPGYPEVIRHVVKVIAEVAHNYEIDAVILDDYFYPYPVAGKKFGDEKSFARHGKEYFPKRLKDWRRENINSFVSALHDTLNRINPKLKFGISPFGIWRNKSVDPQGSSGKKGISSYDDLYADVRKWLKNGWVDYVIPQLYWEKGNHFGDFTSLVQWWSENSYGKPLYIGQALYKSTSEKNGWKSESELTDQINFLRTKTNVKGFAFYSASNMSEMSSHQAKTLLDYHLNSSVPVHESTHFAPSKVIVAAVVPEESDSLKKARMDAIAKTDVLQSIDFNPISIRQEWKSLGGKITFVKHPNGNRSLSWLAESDPAAEWFALVSFKKTGDGRYRQTVEVINQQSVFTFTSQQWEELKDRELVLVCRNVHTRSDKFSDFFQLKRRKVKMMDHLFRRS